MNVDRICFREFSFTLNLYGRHLKGNFNFTVPVQILSCLKIP